MADRSTRYPVDSGGSNAPLRSSSSSSRRPPRNTPSQHLHAPPQQQHQQHPPSYRSQPQQNLFAFNVDFDLVGPLGTGLPADVTGGAGGGDGRGDGRSHLGHSGGGSAGGASGHSGSTSVKSAVVRSSPSFSAKQHDSTESKPEPRHVSSNNSTAHQHHQYLPYAGNNSTATVHSTNSSIRRIAAAESAPRREDYLFSNDLEAAMPYFVDFGGENDSSAGDTFATGAGTGTGTTTPTDSNSGTGSRLKRGVSSTSRSTTYSAATTPSLDDGRQDSSLSMLDDFFTPTLMTSRPAAKSAQVRDKQEQQTQNQHQHQQQHQPFQQTLQDSSLDFFSSLEHNLPSSSTRSSTRSSSSSSPFAQLASTTPLPSFPALVNDYSSLGRGNSHARTAPARKTSQSSANTTAYTSLESVPPASSPLSPEYSGLGLNGTMDTATSLAPPFTPASHQRRKNNAPMSPSPFSSASFTSSTSSAAELSYGQAEPKAFSSAASLSSDSTPASSLPSADSGPNFSSYIDPIAFSAPAPPKITPKPSAKVPSHHPQHAPRQPVSTAGLKSDPLFQSHRQASQHSTSRRVVPAPASQPIKTTVQAMPQHHTSYPTPSPPSPPPQASLSTQPSLQMPPSPWLDDDDDFYHAPTLPPSTSQAATTVEAPPPSHAPAPTTIPMPLPNPTPVPARVLSPVPVPRESSKTPQPPHSKSPKALEEQKPQQQHQKQQQQPKQPKQPKEQPPAPPAKVRKQPPPPLPPKQETQNKQEKLDGQQKTPPMSPAALSPALIKYPPPPPLILYRDDQITISSLHLTIHAFYFPLNTSLTIPLLSITELETLPSAESEGGNNGGMAGWLKYKNWGVSALSDIWWARDPRQTTTTPTAGGNLLTSTLGAAAAAVTVAVPLSRYSNKENTAPLVHVVVRVEGEWLRKGFGVEHERGVKILKEAWKNVKESELGLRPLRPAMTTGRDADGDDDVLVIERAEGNSKYPPDHRDSHGNSNSHNAGGSSEKRRWLTYQNTWTAYPFADDSPQFLAQQQRRGGMTGAGGGVVGAIGATLASKAPRYRQLQRQRTGFAPQTTTSLHSGPDESCGDEPLFIDNDLNVHEEI